MAFELVYTSVPKGIRSGSSGFCTVAYTNGLAANLIVQLESMSAYKAYFPHYDANAALNPVSFSHFVYKHSGQEHHILSRICFYGQDYTRRSNKLASHIVMSSSEISAVPGGPADVFLLDGIVRSEWQGEPELFQKQLHIDAPEQPLRPAERWQEYCGDAGWAGVLAESFLKNPDKPAFIVFDPLKHADMLELIREALMLLPPAARWKVTFNTYLTMMPAGLQCSWRCCVPGSDMLREAHRTPGILVIDLTRPIPPASESGLVQVARTGIAPEPPKPAANSAPPLPPVPPPVIPASAPPQQEKPESGAGTDAAESGAAVPPVIVSPVNTRTPLRITIPKINNAQPRGIQNHPYYQNAVGNGNYRNYRAESAYKGSPSQNGKSKTGILLGGLIAALILAGASAFAIFLWWESSYVTPNTADAERLNPKKTANNGKRRNKNPGKGQQPAGNEKTGGEEPNPSPERDKLAQKSGESKQPEAKEKKGGTKPNSSPKNAPDVPLKNTKPAPSKQLEGKVVNPDYVWQVMQKINNRDDWKGDTWRSSSPVVTPNHGLKVKNVIVSAIWTPSPGKDIPVDKDKNKVVFDSESRELTAKGEQLKGVGLATITLFQYQVQLLDNGFLEFRRKEKDNVKVLTWESLELSNGTTISCKFTPGKTFINPKDTEIKVRRSNGNVSVTLEKVPSELSKQINELSKQISKNPTPYLVFRFNDGEFQIPLKKDKTGIFKGTKVLVQLNQSKRDFIDKLKKDPRLKANIASAKKQVKAKIKSAKKQNKDGSGITNEDKDGSGITEEDVAKFSAGTLFGMPVEKIKQLLKLFKLDTGKDNLSKQFQKCVKRSEKKFELDKLEDKKWKELQKKLKSPETRTETEICCGKFPYMRIDKSKIKCE